MKHSELPLLILMKNMKTGTMRTKIILINLNLDGGPIPLIFLHHMSVDAPNEQPIRIDFQSDVVVQQDGKVLALAVVVQAA